MEFSSNGENEIFFVDGAETSLSPHQAEALTSAAAHFLEVFDIRHEVDVYISKRSSNGIENSKAMKRQESSQTG